MLSARELNALQKQRDHAATALRHIRFHHGNSDGYIALFKIEKHRKKGKEKKNHRQFHYKLEDITVDLLQKWVGNDFYFSMNDFYRIGRTATNLKEFRALYVDLDCYKKNLTPKKVLKILENEFFGKQVPEPSYNILSGRGIQLVWLLEPIPFFKREVWDQVEQFLHKLFDEFGSDPAVLEPSRVFRCDGGINSKNQEEVVVEYRNERRYSIWEFVDEYLPPTPPKSPKRPQSRCFSSSEKKKKPPSFDQPKIHHRFHNLHSLNYSRVKDLETLLSMRNGYLFNCRAIFLFVYGYHFLCNSGDQEATFQAIKEMNTRLMEPLHDWEVLGAFKGALRGWNRLQDKTLNTLAQQNGFQAAGYNYTNETLIRMLSITADEQKHLQTIISREEVRRRNTKFQSEKRRQRGVRPMEQYQHERKERFKDRLEELRHLLAEHENTSNRKLADLMGLSHTHIRKLRSQLSTSNESGN